MFYTDINIIFTEGQDECEAALVENKKNNEITVDEIQAYQDGRYLCAPEACASLFRFEPNQKSHTVQRLLIHLDNRQRTVFEENQAQEAVDTLFARCCCTSKVLSRMMISKRWRSKPHWMMAVL